MVGGGEGVSGSVAPGVTGVSLRFYAYEGRESGHRGSGDPYLAARASAKPAKVLTFDACSPSFNVVFMDPTICNRNGGMPVDVFLQQLEQNRFAGAWHFSPPHVRSMRAIR